jgi:hypothetical protein
MPQVYPSRLRPEIPLTSKAQPAAESYEVPEMNMLARSGAALVGHHASLLIWMPQFGHTLLYPLRMMK